LNPANLGDGSISAGEVVDVNDPALLSTATIQFLTANTYSVNGAGSFAYTSGGDITINGARFQVTGAPQVGDEFVIEANAGGIGDNRNALLLASVGDLKSLTGGTASLNQVVNQVVTRIGAQTLQSASTRDAQNVLLNQATEALKAESGVNLDEEAADLLRYEQSYQAAAQVISIADSLFQTLLAVLRR
jgi:flagellar hook-associated protein 1 FlgK